MIWKGLASLFYPELCNACSESLVSGEKHLCLDCWATLPRTRFHLYDDNPLCRIFTGRIPIIRASSFFFFDKSSRVQQMLHAVKYKGNRRLARFLGECYGRELRSTAWNNEDDILTAIPLHPKKLAMRGFNQSDEFAGGLSSSLQVPFDPGLLARTVFTETQTRKDRLQRWENVENVFEVTAPEKIAGKNVVLADDVLTTGATLEACGHALLEAGARSLKILTIACALKI